MDFFKIKNIAAFLFVLFAIGNVHAQQSGKDSVNVTDEQGWKQGRWVEYSSDGEPEGCQAGLKIEEGVYKDNRKAGVWKMYWCSGKIRNELIYNANRTITSKDYYPNGTLKEEGTWNSFGWIGAYKYYHENGQLYYEWNYDESAKRTGRQRYYYSNGNLMFDGEWNAGNEAGVIKEYYENGSLRAEKSFNNGKLDTNRVKNYAPKEVKVVPEKVVEVKQEINPKTQELGVIKDGYNKTFKDGKVDREGEWKNGKLLDGKQYFYKDGKLDKTAIIREGKISRYE